MNKQIISKFKEKPKTRTAWWAMVLGLCSFFVPPILGIYGAVVRPILDKTFSEKVGAGVGFGLGIAVLILSASALILGVRAYKKGERSWALWLGFVPAILIGLFWISMLVGEFLFPH